MSQALITKCIWYNVMRPPQLRCELFHSIYLPHLCFELGQLSDFSFFRSLIHSTHLLCDFCSSDQSFALGFLQIPPHGGHPCLQLTVPTAKPVVDFHHQVIAHAGRTTQKRCELLFRTFFAIFYIPRYEAGFTRTPFW